MNFVRTCKHNKQSIQQLRPVDEVDVYTSTLCSRREFSTMKTTVILDKFFRESTFLGGGLDPHCL